MTVSIPYVNNGPVFFTSFAKDIKIRLGSNIVASPFTQTYSISKFINHPKYKDALVPDFDVALIKLAEPLQFSDKVQSIPLVSTLPSNGDTCVTSGWGRTDSSLNSRILRKVNVSFLDGKTCARKTSYDKFFWITENMVCAGETGKDGKGHRSPLPATR